LPFGVTHFPREPISVAFWSHRPDTPELRPGASGHLLREESMGVLKGRTKRALTGACALAALLAAPAAGATSYRYMRDLNLITVESGGGTTLTAIHRALPEAPLKLVDPVKRVWLLSADLLITNGSALSLYGSRIGGDVNELRLKSNNTRAPGSFVAITADHGVLDIRATKVTSWDTEAGGPDTEHENFGRAFVRARSRLRSMVLIPLQSRMDIVDSEIQYLGYGAPESYGLVWKVVAPEPYVFDEVRVYGNVINSKIHDNYFGVYTSGAKNSEWRHNEIHHNAQYGLAPHNRSDDLRIEDNDIHHNGHHGITARQRCARIVVRNNRVWDNGEGGIILHRGADDAVITGNRVYNNSDAGIMLYDSARDVVRDNVVRGNKRSGVLVLMGTTDSRVERNDIGDNGYYGLFVGRGKGRVERPDQGLPRRNVIADNLVYGSGVDDLRLGEVGANRIGDNLLLRFQPSDLLAPPDPAPAATAEAGAAQVRDPAPARAAIGIGPTERDLWNAALWAGAVALIATLLLLNHDQRRSQQRRH
jgi:mannuronan 5-epimerase